MKISTYIVYLSRLRRADERIHGCSIVGTLLKSLCRLAVALGKDDALNLTPVRKMTLEDALENIGEDELVEVTLESIRLRKEVLGPGMRK
jgi:predicted membrane GTPase involved in stress response